MGKTFSYAAYMTAFIVGAHRILWQRDPVFLSLTSYWVAGTACLFAFGLIAARGSRMVVRLLVTTLGSVAAWTLLLVVMPMGQSPCHCRAAWGIWDEVSYNAGSIGFGTLGSFLLAVLAEGIRFGGLRLLSARTAAHRRETQV